MGVSASYLSQIRNGARPASAKVLSNSDAKRLLKITTHESVKQKDGGLGRDRTYDQSVNCVAVL